MRGSLCSISYMAIWGSFHVILTIVNVCLYGNPWMWAVNSLKWWSEEYCGSRWETYKTGYLLRRDDAIKYKVPSFHIYEQKYQNMLRDCEKDYMGEFINMFVWVNMY